VEPGFGYCFVVAGVGGLSGAWSSQSLACVTESFRALHYCIGGNDHLLGAPRRLSSVHLNKGRSPWIDTRRESSIGHSRPDGGLQ
jgi:hypothetical protein